MRVLSLEQEVALPRQEEEPVPEAVVPTLALAVEPVSEQVVVPTLAAWGAGRVGALPGEVAERLRSDPAPAPKPVGGRRPGLKVRSFFAVSPVSPTEEPLHPGLARAPAVAGRAPKSPVRNGRAWQRAARSLLSDFRTAGRRAPLRSGSHRRTHIPSAFYLQKTSRKKITAMPAHVQGVQ